MSVAVELGFDPESENRLVELWQTLEGVYGKPRRSELGVSPHLSLTLFPEGQPPFLREELSWLAGRTRAFVINLVSAESFPTSEGVVYLAPQPNDDLRSLHGELHAAIVAHGEAGHSYYHPDSWLPHCTVATDVPDRLRGSVLSACLAAEPFGQVVVQRIRAVAYQPARVLYEFALRGPP